MCTSGVANTLTGDVLAYSTGSHMFTGTMSFNSTPKVSNVALALISDIPSLTSYATKMDVTNTLMICATLVSPALRVMLLPMD